MSEWTWIASARTGTAHAYLTGERGPLERLALARVERRFGAPMRKGRCGESSLVEELSIDASGRRCRRCERHLAAGNQARWLETARKRETPAQIASVVHTDNAQGLELAERIARDVARELSAADAPDYVREAMRSAAAGAALMVAERIGRTARGTRAATVVDLDDRRRALRAEGSVANG